jgi:PAS domain S-box-containing protein
MAIAAGKMGSWDWDWINGDWMWDAGQYRIFGVDPRTFKVTSENVQALLHPDDADGLRKVIAHFEQGGRAYETEFRIRRPDGEIRWCVGTAAATVDKAGRVVRLSGVTVDITERKRAEERQNLLAREVDHRAKNALALAQSIVRLTRASDVKDYVQAVEGRISALARVHTILSLSNWEGAEVGRLVDEEIAPYSSGDQIEFYGPELKLQPATAQTLALALHELVTNSAKYGALSTLSGRLRIGWEVRGDALQLTWEEKGGPPVEAPLSRGFGTRSVIASIETQLGGKAEFDWKAEGLVCQLSVPVSRNALPREAGHHPSHLANGRAVEPALRRA